MDPKILVLPPPETDIGETIKRWFDGFGYGVTESENLEQILANASLIVGIGDRSIDQLMDLSNFPNLLENKVIYHLGHSKPSPRVLFSHQKEPKGYIGYADEVMILTGEKERLFRDVFLTSVHALNEEKNLQTVFERTRNAWNELAARFRSEDPLASMLAAQLREDIVFYGDPEWRISDFRQTTAFHPEEVETQPQVAATPQEIRGKGPPVIEVVNFTPQLLKSLELDPEYLAQLSPDKFEDLVAELLHNIGLQVIKTGSTYRRDGGIDLIAYPPPGTYPFLIAAQVKHSRVGAPVQTRIVRELRGVLTSLPFDIGMIVTNTDFTPDAKWAAAQMPRIIRLHNREDIREWMSGEIKDSAIFREFPSSIEIAPGIKIPITRTIQ
jgi:hypothetical protein